MVPTWIYLLLVTSQLIYVTVSHLDDYDDEQQSSDDALSIHWGIQDRETVVGKLFHCKIPPERDAFKGTIVEYDVEGEEPDTFPKWLIFDKRRSVLEGVATIDDIGDTRINVKAYDSKGKSVKDMFVIEVNPLENENTNTKRKCRNGEQVMMLAIVIDRNINDISPTQRIAVIRTLARTLNIPQDTILMLPQLPTLDSSPAFLRTDTKFDETNVNSSVLTWQIGCNERIWAEQLEMVTLVKKLVKSNNLADMLQLPISQWRLIANFNPFRMRREVPNNDNNSHSNNNMDLDDAADDIDDEADEGDEDDDEKISSSPSLDMQLSSVGVNESLLSQHSRVEDNSTWSQSSNFSKPNHVSTVSQNIAEDEDTMTVQPEEFIFDRQNESFSLGPTPDLESSVTPFQCISCSSSDSNTSTEKATIAPTSANLPPRVLKNIGPITVTAGKPRRELIPEDTFVDEAGHGNTRNMSLRLITKSSECKPETIWIELDSETQTLFILASSDAISKYEIPLEATNSANISSNTSITIVVQYPQQERKINFEISLHLYRKSRDQRITTKLQLQLLDLIAKLYGDADTDKIMLRHITCDPLVFTWTNTSLSLDFCDNSTIHNLLMVLVKDGGTEANDDVHRTIDPLIDVEKVTWIGKGLCEGVLPPARATFKPSENHPPTLRNHIDNITARVGELLVYRIPEDAFNDPDVPSIRELRLTVTLLGQNSLPRDNWLQFDDKNLEIYGLPMNSDVGLTSYMLVCYDNKETENEEKAVRQTIEVKVEPALKRQYNVEFSIRLNSSYTSFDEFNRVPMLRRTLIKKLSELFGDKDTNSIVVSGYRPGSLIVIWHNRTLPTDTCPEEEIENLRKVILTDKKELNERVNQVLQPEFQAISVLVAPTGICEGGLTETHVTEVPVKTASQEISLFFSKMDFQYYLREYFVEVIMPVIIIILMMTFAGIVACILYRRQRRAKWNLNDETERRTYRNRGIPVIFQDELEERLETSNKSPIIMKEEKPPLPPPEYQKTLPMATTALLSDFDDPSYHQEGGSYSPRNTERSGREKSSTPTYRKPPPYIPP